MSTMSTAEHHQVLILGGGTAGCALAAQLKGQQGVHDMCIVEPAETHYYQPAWTFVGAGIFPLAESARPMATTIPNGVTWVKDTAAEINPESMEVRCGSGKRLSYDYLVVATGLQLDWDQIPGLVETLGKNGVCSNYHPQSATYTWETMQSLKAGNAIFTQPATPVKCGGAPQKIMWLTDDYLRREGRHREDVQISFVLPQKQIFGVDKYSKVLTEQAKARGVNCLYETTLVSIDGPAQMATLRRQSDGQETQVPFSMLHVTPPMSAPDFLKTSPLANEKGFVDVDQYTLQHLRYPNVFALGDSSSLPTSKTMAAITGQAPVLAHNLVRVIQGKKASAQYDGYTSCPVVLGYDKLLMTEFKYGCIPCESFTPIPLPFLDQGKPSYFYFLVKKYVFPFVYWNLLMRGSWFGPKLIFKPEFSQLDREMDEAGERSRVVGKEGV